MKKNEILAKCAEKSLYGDLLYFFERNPRYKLKQTELVAILGLVAQRLEHSIANKPKQTNAYLIH